MLYANVGPIPAHIGPLWFVGHYGQTQIVIQIAPIYAVVISIAVLLMGVLIGVWAGWFLTGQDLKRAKQENDQLRESWETGKVAQAQLSRERDAIAHELKDMRDQLTMIEAQLKSRQRLLDQANDYLQNNDQQLNLAHANLKQQRQIVEELRTRLIDAEHVASQRNIENADLLKEIAALRRRAESFQTS